jgi:hypothetical protein
MKLVRIFLVVALMANLGFGLRQLVLRGGYGDFFVYDTAASLVRSGQSMSIYDGADTGVDPQVRWADPDSKFAAAARFLGISPVRLYVYPPLLADLMVPFSLLPAIAAARLWFALCTAMLVAAGAIAARAMGARWRSWAMLAWISAILGLGLYSLSWGQVTPLLCLLWSLGIFTYKKESPNLSAVALALGTAIKLTPVLAVIPFLVCREWKWLRAYLLSLIVLIAAMVMLNGPASLLDYQVHVLPSMSAGYPDPYNFSISSAFRLLYLVVRRPPSFTSAAPQAVATLCSVLTVAVTCWMIRRRRETLSQREWWAILAAISMLSVSLAPVSFQQAYIVVAFPLGFLWLDLLRGGLRPFFTPVVIAATLEYATFATKIFRNARFAPIGGGLCALIPPAVGIVIALLCIARAPDPQSQLVPKLVKTDRNEAIAGPA